jgi:rRNA processing protein Krr1/Pno1
MFTFVAIMGCLPASRSAVSMIMMLMQKSTDPEVYRQVEERAGDLVRAYELTISAYEKNTSIDSLVICGYHVAAYSSDPKTDVTFAQNHIKEILKGNGYRADVKIFTDLKHYLDRVSSLEKQREKLEAEISFTPKEGFPDLSRSEMVRETIYAISL